jgi:hypothetical protein
MTIGSGIRVILRTLLQQFVAIVLVLLMKGIYDVLWHGTNTNFHEVMYWFSGNIEVIHIGNLRDSDVGSSDGRDLWYRTMRCLHTE